jgi:hypothetical protein
VEPQRVQRVEACELTKRLERSPEEKKRLVHP